MEKFGLKMSQFLKSYVWMVLLPLLASPLLPGPGVLLAGEGEKKVEEIRGSMSLETVARNGESRPLI